MGDFYEAISNKHKAFILEQQMFFVATSIADARINLSPKGLDTFRIINDNTVVWLNFTGSGNETSAHLSEGSQMTVMFCSFTKRPLILRLYGNARIFHEKDEGYKRYIGEFEENCGARQIIEMQVDLVQTSCGFGVPLYEFVEQRKLLPNWGDTKGRDAVKQYWAEKNSTSIDGKVIKF